MQVKEIKHCFSCDVIYKWGSNVHWFFHFAIHHQITGIAGKPFTSLLGVSGCTRIPYLIVWSFFLTALLKQNHAWLEWSCSVKMNIPLPVKLRMLLAVLCPAEHLCTLKNQNYSYQLKVDEQPLTPLQWSTENSLLFSSAGSGSFLTSHVL